MSDTNPPYHDDREYLEALLAEYYQAAEARQVSLEDAMLAALRSPLMRWCRHWKDTPADVEDRCQEASVRLLAALRQSRSGSAPRIYSLMALGKKIAKNLLIDEARRNDPGYRLHLRVRYLLDKPDSPSRFARWERDSVWLIGPASWRGKPFRETSRYSAFCQNQSGFLILHERLAADAAQGKLAELLERLFATIETPLPETVLVAHLVALVPVKTPPGVVPFEELPPSQEPVTQSPARHDWSVVWKAVTDLSPNARTVFVLRLSQDMLAVLTGEDDPLPLLAETIQRDPRTVEKLWQELPMSNEAIAKFLGVSVGNVYTMFSRCMEKIKKEIKSSAGV